MSLGLLGFTEGFWLPKDFFVQHPQLVNTPLHPWMAALYGGMGLAIRWFVYLCTRSPINNRNA